MDKINTGLSEPVKFIPENRPDSICFLKNFVTRAGNFGEAAIGKQRADRFLGINRDHPVTSGAHNENRCCDLFGKIRLGKNVYGFKCC